MAQTHFIVQCYIREVYLCLVSMNVKLVARNLEQSESHKSES